MAKGPDPCSGPAILGPAFTRPNTRSSRFTSPKSADPAVHRKRHFLRLGVSVGYFSSMIREQNFFVRHIRAIMPLCAALVWISSAQAQIASYRFDDWVTFRNFRFVNTIDVGRRYAWVGTTGGLMIFDLWRKAWTDPQTSADGMIGQNIAELHADNQTDRVWVRTESGISYYEPGMATWFAGGSLPLDTSKSEPLDLTVLHLDAPYFFDGRAVRDPAGNSFRVTAAVEANPGNFILGTWGLGAGYGSIRMKLGEMKPFGLRGDDVSAILADDGFLWFGSEEQGGLSRLDTRSGAWAHFHAPALSALMDNRITALAADIGAVWIGTYAGLVKFDKKENRFETFCPGSLCNRAITALIAESGGLLVGTDAGLCRITRAGEVRWITSPLQPLGTVQCLLPRGDTTWVGTEHGLFRSVLSSALVRPDSFSRPVRTPVLHWQEADHPALRGQSIHCLFGVDSCIWAGSAKGLLEVTPGFLASQIGGRGTPLDRPVYTIQRAGKTFWLGTSEGVVEIDRIGLRWTAYTTGDGLINKDVLVSANQDEYIWFGTRRGTTRCRWKSVRERKSFELD